jgi:hypothetical protein
MVIARWLWMASHAGAGITGDEGTLSPSEKEKPITRFLVTLLRSFGAIVDRMIQFVKRREELNRGHYTDLVADCMRCVLVKCSRLITQKAVPEDGNAGERSPRENRPPPRIHPNWQTPSTMYTHSLSAETLVHQRPYDSLFEQLVELLRIRCRVVVDVGDVLLQ